MSLQRLAALAGLQSHPPLSRIDVLIEKDATAFQYSVFKAPNRTYGGEIAWSDGGPWQLAGYLGD